MFVFNTFLVSGMILQMLFLISSTTDSEEWCQKPTNTLTSSLPGLNKPSSLPPAMWVLWCHPVNSAYIPIWSKCLLIILLLFQHYSQTSFISNSSMLYCGCSAPYAYIGPYAYGTSHMRILIWDAHTRMGQHFVPYEYFICMFYFFTDLWILLL